MAIEQSEAVTARSKRWHQSTLSTLLDGCSWQYFLTYILEQEQGIKPYATVGTAYHSAVELHERNRMINIETTEQEMLDVAFKYIKEIIEDKELCADLQENCKAAINNWYLFHREWLLQFTPIAIEPEFTLPLVDFARPIGGWIDAVYYDTTNDKYFIVDHKTAKNFDRWRDGEGHRYQAAMYSAALVLSEDFPMITDMLEMVYMVSRTSNSTRKNFEHIKTVRVQPDINDVKLLGDRIRQAENIVQEESYKPNTDWFLCSPKWCPFYEGCQVTGALSGTVTDVTIKVRQQYKTESENDSSITNNTSEGGK